jgi:hypothetical protein
MRSWMTVFTRTHYNLNLLGALHQATIDIHRIITIFNFVAHSAVRERQFDF